MSSDIRLPFLPLYVKDFLLSKQVRTMSVEQVGAYILLLCEQWDSAECLLPDDPHILAGLSRLADRWEAVKEGVLACFTKSKKFPHKMFNKKLREIWIQQKKVYEAKQRGGKSSGKSRRTGSNTLSRVFEESLKSPRRLREHTDTETDTDRKKKENPSFGRGKEKANERTVSARTRKTGTRLSPAWVLPDEWNAWAAAYAPDVAACVEQEADMFRDYWISKSGQQATKLDWAATWRNWWRRASAQRREQRSLRSAGVTRGLATDIWPGEGAG